MLEKLKNLLYSNRTNAYKAGFSTAVVSFISLFGMSLIGFINDVTVWATDTGITEFPSVEPLGKALIAAVSASVIGIINWVIRTVQAKTNLPGNGPTYN